MYDIINKYTFVLFMKQALSFYIHDIISWDESVEII
jgi:hypothetical protein